MKTILVPMDFSANSENALFFAVLMAKKLSCRLVLLHAYQVPMPVAAVPYDITKDDIAAMKRKAENKLRDAALKVGYAGGVDYEYIAAEGPAVDVILDKAAEKHADLLIMGTRGATGFGSSVFGSIASRVMEKAICPVVAVPDKTPFQTPIRKITYATDYHQSDLQAIEVLAQFASALKAQLNILHIAHGHKMDVLQENDLLKKFMKTVTGKVSYNNLSFQVLSGDDVEQELEEYIEDENTDMIVMATHVRTFFEKIFGESFTRHMVLYSSIPVMAFHYNPRSAVKLF